MGKDSPANDKCGAIPYRRCQVDRQGKQGKAEFGYLYPTHKKYTSNPLKIGTKNTVLLSVRAPVGDVNMAQIEYCIGRGLSSLSLKEGDNRFLFYILQFIKPSIAKEGTGSTFKAITKPKLQSIKIPLPPSPNKKKSPMCFPPYMKPGKRQKQLSRLSGNLKSP
ncbi:MAG: restriction endonuclease subunit S [Spirochaetales bacterium]|nr:restriction endonuclease subunit S [Spirochaetales bacterium]